MKDTNIPTDSSVEQIQPGAELSFPINFSLLMRSINILDGSREGPMLQEPDEILQETTPSFYPAAPSHQHVIAAGGRAPVGVHRRATKAEVKAFKGWVEDLRHVTYSLIPMPAIPMPAIPMPAIEIEEPPQGIINREEPATGTNSTPQKNPQNPAMNNHYPYLKNLLGDYPNTKSLYLYTRNKPTGNNLNRLHIAAISGETKTVENILKEDKTNRNTEVPFYNLTPLHLAALNGHTETVQVLLANGADTKMLDRMDRTAFELATLNGHAETAKNIEEYKLNERLNEGINAIMNVHKTGPNFPTRYPGYGVVTNISESEREMFRAFESKRTVADTAKGKDSAPPEPAIKRTFPDLEQPRGGAKRRKNSNIPPLEQLYDPTKSRINGRSEE